MWYHRLIVTGLAAALAASAADAANFYVFGDSLVDSGNGFSVRPDKSSPTDGYYPGRYSNGYNFADYLAGATNPPVVPAAPLTAAGVASLGGATAAAFGGRNFAVGGAAAANIGGESLHFSQQIDRFQAAYGTFDPDALVLVTFGGNDIQYQLEQAGKGIAYDAVGTATAALKTNLDRLIGLGARNILVTGEADVGDIPKVQALGQPAIALGTSLSKQLNYQFSLVTASERQTGYNIRFFDLLGFESMITANPGAYGLTDLDNPCQVRNVPYALQPCGSSLYFDAIHPTTNVHGLIADGLRANLAAPFPEPATWASMLLGFGLVGAALRRRPRPLAA